MFRKDRQWKDLIHFRSAEEAQRKTGKFAVGKMIVTDRLGVRIEDYIRNKGISTYRRQNKNKTSNNTYTLNFVVRNYFDKENYWLTAGGNEGHLGFETASRTQYIEQKGTFRRTKLIHRPSISAQEKFNRIARDTPSLTEIYFWICRKYPTEILAVDYSFQSQPYRVPEMKLHLPDDDTPVDKGWVQLINEGKDPAFDSIFLLRKELAILHGVPEYVVCQDFDLERLADARPRNLKQFLDIKPRFGTKILNSHARDFVDAINNALDEN